MSNVKISYKNLRKINPETARAAVMEYLSSNGGNISDCARVFGIQRLTIYDIVKKHKQDNLKDRSKAPIRIANKTSTEVVNIILKAWSETRYGAKRLNRYLENYNVKVPLGTLRGILRRNPKVF